MTDDLDEIERLAREATNPRPWMAHHVAHALHSHLTPARVLALVARLRRAEEERGKARTDALNECIEVCDDIATAILPYGERHDGYRAAAAALAAHFRALAARGT
jgi:hypothetical protein